MQDVCCKHYNGVISNTTCEADISYRNKCDKSKTDFNRWPCFKSSTSKVECVDCVFPTREEIEEREAKVEEAVEYILQILRMSIRPR